VNIKDKELLQEGIELLSEAQARFYELTSDAGKTVAFLSDCTMRYAESIYRGNDPLINEECQYLNKCIDNELDEKLIKKYSDEHVSKSMMICCPWHKEITASLFYCPITKHFYCFTCEEEGSREKLVKKLSETYAAEA
jgi:hypothetical protein